LNKKTLPLQHKLPTKIDTHKNSLTPPTQKLVAILLTIETQCSKAQEYIKRLLQLHQQQKHTQKAQRSL
jgi:hypothetical protein